MRLLTVEIPEGCRASGELESVDDQLAYPLTDFWIFLTRPTNTRQIAFDIGHENRDADSAKFFGDDPQSQGFPGAGSPGDQTMTMRGNKQQTPLPLAIGSASGIP